MTTNGFASLCALASLTLLGSAGLASSASAQDATSAALATSARPVDPGVRGGPAGAGGPLPGLGRDELNFFAAAKEVFKEVDSVSGNAPGAPGSGLGPRFNLDSCAGCHQQPAVGGSSPPVNPQVAVATKQGANNTVPPFIRANGPVREARFITNPDGTPDGGVHDLFVISGRTDAPGCHIQQPDFAGALAAKNVIFRIPTPTFGLGLVETVSDSTLVATLAAHGSAKQNLGISGRLNRNGNDGTVTRFGWKAQNKSLLIFSGEAYNVEQGVTNENFPNERETDPNCQFNGTPEDPTRLTLGTSGSAASDISADIVNFASFMRMSAPPAATTPSATIDVASADPNAVPTVPSATRGQTIFANIGCALCHVPQLTTGKSSMTGQSNVTFAPFSDFAVHNMGVRLADGVSQGNAQGDEFRSAPLWGVGKRIFFLHDGRTSDLYEAIQQHASSGSEANAVIQNYNLLSVDDRQAVLNYLRSL